MSTIFSRSYEENLLRVSARTSSNKLPRTDSKDASSHFVKVLGELEQEAKSEGKSNNLAQSSPGPVAKSGASGTSLLSNLNNSEFSALSSLKSAVSIPAENNLESLNSVKLTAPDVKTLSGSTHTGPTQTIAPSATPSAPAIPSILGFKRLQPSAKEVAQQYGRQDVRAIVSEAGKFHGVDPALGLAVAKAESDFQTNAVSRDGFNSKGLFQLLDSTGRELLSQSDLDSENYNPFNPHLNAHLGVGYLKRLISTFNSSTQLKGNLSTVPAKTAADLEKLAIAAFNTGEGNVARAQERAMALGKDPSEFTSVEPHLAESTRAYVQRVLKIRDELAQVSSVDGTA